MTEIITIDIIENGEGGHKDLLFSIPEIIGSLELDTYYFCIAVEPIETIDDIKNAVSQLIQFWVSKVSEIKKGDTIYLPIDFSDEYTGCLKIEMPDDKLLLTYGYSRREGYSVNPLNPENFYNQINDFEPYSKKQLIVEQNVFISALNKQLQKLIGEHPGNNLTNEF